MKKKLVFIFKYYKYLTKYKFYNNLIFKKIIHKIFNK